jgi:hypothetical protein
MNQDLSVNPTQSWLVTRVSAAESIESVRRHAAQLFHRGVPYRRIEQFLIDESTEPTVAHEVVLQLATHHKRLRVGALGAAEFIRWFAWHPFRSGVLGWLWLAALMSTVVGAAVFLGTFAGGALGAGAVVALKGVHCWRLFEPRESPREKT